MTTMRNYNKKSDYFDFFYKNLLVLTAPLHKVDSNHITYILAGVLLMKLFHGTKATLDTFSIEYPGSGERSRRYPSSVVYGQFYWRP